MPALRAQNGLANLRRPSRHARGYEGLSKSDGFAVYRNFSKTVIFIARFLAHFSMGT
jgi:hypothetical protein